MLALPPRCAQLPSDNRTKEKRMSKSAHTEAQMIGPVKQVEAAARPEEVARELGAKNTICAWKQKLWRAGRWSCRACGSPAA